MTFGVSMHRTVDFGPLCSIGEIEPIEGGDHGAEQRLSRAAVRANYGPRCGSVALVGLDPGR
jgi:hypothetical protein